MKAARRNLLESLNNRKTVNPDAALTNVKKALGSLSSVAGNPLTKTQITLNIDIIFYDRLTTLTVAPAALPVNLQVPLPVFIFGLTDFWGAYRRMQQFLPPMGGWVLAPTWLIGSFPVGIFGLTADVPLSADFSVSSRPGDMVIHYADPNPASNLNACVRVHCENVAYGTFLNSFASDLITLDSIRYITPLANPTQLDNAFIMAHQSLFGKTVVDNLDPRMFTFSSDFQGNRVDIPLNLPIDKSIMMGTYINFDCPNFDLILFVKKVEKLTHPK